MTIMDKRLSVRFPSHRTRIAMEEHRAGSGWVVRVILPAQGQSVAIRSARYDAWDSARDALVREVLTVGDALMADAYHRLKQAVRIWKCGRVGIRPRSGAAFNQVLSASASIVDVALPCARIFRTLLDHGGLEDGTYTTPDWLACALDDLQEGLTENEAGFRLAETMRR